MQFWKALPERNAQTWLVVGGKHVFEMSDNALDANGVNMYSGPLSDHEFSWISGSMELIDNIKEVPADVCRAALLRFAPIVDNEKD